MTVGLVGSHRTGKTTLAEAVSNETGMPLVLTPTSKVFQQAGIDPSLAIDPQTRIEIQHKVLDAAIETWKAERGWFITDRTPIDMMAYTLADVGGDWPDEQQKPLQDYIDRCFDAVNVYFSTLVIVQPGIEIVRDTSKATAALNRGYMEHFNSLVFGLSYDPRCQCSVFYLKRDMLDLKERVRGVMYALNKVTRLHLPEVSVVCH